MTLDDIYPAFGVEIWGGPLRLRGLGTEDIPAVTEVAVRGIHGPDFLPFLYPWSEAAPDELPIGAARFYWDSFASFTPQRWHLNLVARWEDQVVGVQDVFARTDFRKRLIHFTARGKGAFRRTPVGRQRSPHGAPPVPR